jgi:hypothetical protein
MDTGTPGLRSRGYSCQAKAQPPPGPAATDTAMLGRTMRSAPWWARRAYPAVALLASDGDRVDLFPLRAANVGGVDHTPAGWKRRVVAGGADHGLDGADDDGWLAAV